MLVMAARLEGTVARNADIMYLSPEELLADLRTVQRLARARRCRTRRVRARANADMAG